MADTKADAKTARSKTEEKTDQGSGPLPTRERAGRRVEPGPTGIDALPEIPDNTVGKDLLESDDYLVTHGHNPLEANTGDF